MFFGRYLQLIVESVVPDLFHIVPVGDHTVRDWLLDFEHIALLLSFGSNVDFLLVEANHDSRNLWPTHDSGEDRSGGIIASKTSLAHSRAIIDHDSSYEVTHTFSNN